MKHKSLSLLTLLLLAAICHTAAAAVSFGNWRSAATTATVSSGDDDKSEKRRKEDAEGEAKKRQKLNEAVKRMKEKIVDLKEFGEDGKSKPFTVNGPYGETLFVVKTADGNFETTPSGFRVEPTAEDVTKWMFVQEDGSLGKSPAVKSGSGKGKSKIKTKSARSKPRRASGEEEEEEDYDDDDYDDDDDVITIQYNRRNKRHTKKVHKRTNRNKRNAKVEV